jgi:hypothetical protein
MSKGDATVLATSKLYEKKAKQLVERLPSSLVSSLRMQTNITGKVISFPPDETSPTDFKIPETNPERCLLHFTSGTPSSVCYMCIMVLPIT